MEYIETIGFVFSGLVIIILVIILINEAHETKQLKEEREKCILMISRCCVLLGLLESSSYMTNLDFHFLRHRIYRNYIRIHEMPFKTPSSEEERLILAEGIHWISTLGERENTINGETYHENSSCPYEKVLNMVVAGFTGFSINKNTHEDLEWIYYMWLMGVFMRAESSQESVNREELKHLCFRIEKWITNYDINSQYLKDKIKECRENTINKIV